MAVLTNLSNTTNSTNLFNPNQSNVIPLPMVYIGTNNQSEYTVSPIENNELISSICPISPIKPISHKQSHNKKTEVYAIKSQQDRIAIQKYFINQIEELKSKRATLRKLTPAYRNLLAFQLGINIGLRASDLLSLTWDKIFDLNGDFINTDDNFILEKKTKKDRLLVFNEACQQAIMYFLKATKKRINIRSDRPMDKYVFFSQKAHTDENGNSVNHLTVSSYNEILSKAAKQCGIKYNVGTHSMRKTWCYNIIKNNASPEIIVTVSKLLNHSSPAITYRYCGIDQEQQREVYFNNSIFPVFE